MLIADYEREAESFLEEIEREQYLSAAGLKETLDIQPIFDRHQRLFERGVVEELLAGRSERSRWLAEFGARGYLEARVKDLTEAVRNAEMRATVLWDGEQVAYRRTSVLLANEADAERRHSLERLRHDKAAELNQLRRERLARVWDEVVGLGFEGYAPMCDELRGLNLAWLSDEMARLLDVTRESYRARLEAYLDEMDVPRTQATTADLTFLFRAQRFDDLFPAGELASAVKRWLASIGIDVGKQPNVEMDLESRPLKSPRAFCFAIRVPHEVKLAISPRGGSDDYSALLHELGHAEHFANVDPELDFAARRLGDNSVTEAYAFLFDNLMANTRWLASVFGIDCSSAPVREFARMERFKKAYFLRRYAAKLRYELGLHSGEFGDPAAAYQEILSEATAVGCSPKVYLADVDDFFYCAQYTRAWIFEVMLRRHLEERFGPEWFVRESAGEFLKSLWRNGQRLSADEMAINLGWNGLDAEPLIQELTDIGDL